jgi:hypothetical protein
MDRLMKRHTDLHRSFIAELNKHATLLLLDFYAIARAREAVVAGLKARSDAIGAALDDFGLD